MADDQSKIGLRNYLTERGQSEKEINLTERLYDASGRPEDYRTWAAGLLGELGEKDGVRGGSDAADRPTRSAQTGRGYVGMSGAEFAALSREERQRLHAEAVRAAGGESPFHKPRGK